MKSTAESLTISPALKTLKKPKVLLGISAGLVLGAGVYWYFRARKYVHRPVRGGMSTGHDPKAINLDSRYHDEGELERDVVDQAVMESFITSDPPAY